MIKKTLALFLAFSIMCGQGAWSQSFIDLNEDGRIYNWSRDLLRYCALMTEESGAAPAEDITAAAADYTMSVNDPYYNSYGTWSQPYYDMWGLRMINAEDAWKLSTGEGVTVAQVDTGLDYTHPDINDNIWANDAEANGLAGVDDDGNGYVDDIHGWNFYGSDSNDPADVYGHGTHVAGVIAAEGDNGEGTIGIAYGAKIMPLRIFNSWGGGIPADAAEAIIYAVNMGVRVINCSFGFPYENSALTAAVNYACAHGVIIVAAAGNENKEINVYPAHLDNVITVGAVNPSGVRASFSNYGSMLDFMAPGYDILSLRAAGLMTESDQYFVPAYDPDAQYLRMKGTSMATAYVSGLVALLLSQCPYMTYDDVLRRVTNSCVDLGDEGRDDYTGYGLIDAYTALSYDWYDTGEIKTWWTFDEMTQAALRYDYQLSGAYSLIEYWTDTHDTHYEHHYGTAGEWLNTLEYYQDGVTMHRQWIPDPDGSSTGDLISFVYDTMGRTTRSNYDNDDWILTGYWDETPGANRRYDTFLDSVDQWQKTIEYYADGVTMHKQWLPDPNVLGAGDIISFEYDQLGRIIRSNYDNNDWILTSYWDETAGSNKRYDTFLDSGDVWQKTIGYYEDGVTMRRQWIADPDGTSAGDIISFEYDNLGRVVRSNYDNNDWILTSYWDDTAGSARRYESYLDSCDQWQKTIEYYEDGVSLHRQWVKDPDPSNAGDVTCYEYDEMGRIKASTLDDNGRICTDYWDGTPGANKRCDTYIDAADRWIKTIEYWEDGATMHYQWLADPNPGMPGDVVYEEYDIDGNLIYQRYDDGSGATLCILSDNTGFDERLALEQDVINVPGQEDGITYTGEPADTVTEPRLI